MDSLPGSACWAGESMTTLSIGPLKAWIILAAWAAPIAALLAGHALEDDRLGSETRLIPGFQPVESYPGLLYGGNVVSPVGQSGIGIPVESRGVFQYSTWIKDEDTYSEAGHPGSRVKVFSELIGFRGTVTSGHGLARSHSFENGKLTITHVLEAHDVPKGQTFIKYDRFTPTDLENAGSLVHDKSGAPIAFLVEVKGPANPPTERGRFSDVKQAVLPGPDSGRLLAEAIHRETKKTTVICSPRRDSFVKAASSSLPDDLQALSASLKTSTGLRQVLPSEACFAWPSYPGKMTKSSFFGSRQAEEEPVTKDQGSLSIRARKVTTSQGSSRLFLQNLPLAGFSKPVTVHWFLHPLSVTLSCEEESEETVLRLIAEAVGAEFSESANGYRIGFSASRFRTRAIASYKDPEIMAAREITKEDSAFFVEALKQFTDEEITKVYESPGGYLQSPAMPGIKAHTLMKARIAKEFDSPSEILSPSRNEIRQWITQQVDMTAPFFLELRPNVPPGVGLPVRERQQTYFGF